MIGSVACFFRNTKKLGRNKNDCWMWTGPMRGSYGKAFVKYVSEGQRSIYMAAHRYAFELFYGPIPRGMCVCHKCDVRLCVNPNHLWIGTKADNNLDKCRKGRGGWLVGEKSASAKLSNMDVVLIKKRLVSGESQKKIATDYRVSPQAIFHIKSGRNWKSVARIDQLRGRR